MRFEIYALSLLAALEEYLPYMSEEEIRAILYYGMEPDSLTVWGWELRKTARRSELARRFRDAYGRQKK